MLLNFEFIKNDKPTLVMLHGLLSSLETFYPVIETLKTHFSILLIDQRGHGKSERLGDLYTVEQMAKDLKETLDHLGVEKIFLLGHSMGGRTALKFGELYPESIEKLIIEDIGIQQRQIRTKERDEEKKRMAQKCQVTSLVFKNKQEIFDLISPLYSYANELMKTKVIEHSPDRFELTFWPDVSVMYGYQGNYTDLTSTLTSTQFPVLFLVAEIGSAMTTSCYDHIKNHVPRAKLVQIPKSGHSIHKTHPKEFCDSLIEFCFNESAIPDGLT